jgi:hypothetical protein
MLLVGQIVHPVIPRGDLFEKRRELVQAWPDFNGRPCSPVGKPKKGMFTERSCANIAVWNSTVIGRRAV